MPILNLQVGASTDDAHQLQNGASYSHTSAVLQILASTVGASSRNTGGMRFASVPIPKGATINSAVLQTYIASASFLTIDATLYGAAEDNPATFNSTTNDVVTVAQGGDRVYTSTSVPWAHTYSGMGFDTEAKPDVTSIIQEIIDRANWASGDALVLFVAGDSGTITECRLRAWDFVPNGISGAKLVIDYTPGTQFVVPRPDGRRRYGTTGQLSKRITIN